MAASLRLATEVGAVEHVNGLGDCFGHPNPGNVTVGGAFIGNIGRKWKALGRLRRSSRTSPNS
jgi:hypothetical protein